MIYSTEIRLKHTDPVVLADDLRAVTQLLERRNAERHRGQIPSGAQSAIIAAERIVKSQR